MIIILKGIQALISAELHRAEHKYKPINSSKEGYAVIKEEVEELEEEFYDLKNQLDSLWLNVKGDDLDKQKEIVIKMYYYSLGLIKEAVQVAAMAERYRKDLNLK